jgi:hypothetical protein
LKSWLIIRKASGRVDEKHNGYGRLRWCRDPGGLESRAGGRHRLVVNPALAHPAFGTLLRTVNLQRNRRNQLTPISLQELSREAPFQYLEGRRQLSLARGEKTLQHLLAELQ